MGLHMSKNYHEQQLFRSGLSIASLVAGFTLGFGLLTAWKAYKQTRRIENPWTNIFLWFIWGEIFAITTLVVITMLLLNDAIKPSLGLFLTILTFWTFELQFILQIIANRVGLIVLERRKARNIKLAVFFSVLAVNITVWIIWLPAQLQMSKKFIRINEIEDRIEKLAYLAIDATMNIYFMCTVRNHLVKHGLNKYDRLWAFNLKMIVISLGMDLMVIASMSINNPFIYMIFQPLAFTVKLNIELTMAELIRKVAAEKIDVARLTIPITYESGDGSVESQIQLCDTKSTMTAVTTERPSLSRLGTLPSLSGVPTNPIDRYGAVVRSGEDGSRGGPQLIDDENSIQSPQPIHLPSPK